jgi:LysM repeat protein
MSVWERFGLAQADNIHLTVKGYTLKGELLGSAFKNTISKLHIETPSLVFNPDTLSFDNLIALQDSIMKKNANISPVAQSQNTKPVNVVYHKIAKGETLGEIAEKYHVSVSSIRYANGLSGSKIIAGKTLRIEQPQVYVVTASNNTGKVKQTAANKKLNQVFDQIANTKLIQHKIATGETLGEIATKYNVTVKDLKKTNGLKSSKIIAGKTLLIEVPIETEKKSKT